MGRDDMAPSIAVEGPSEVGRILSPFKWDAWLRLSPRERLRKSWAMRSRLKDAQAAHDRKLLPAP